MTAPNQSLGGEILTTAEVAELLKCSTDSVIRWIKRKEMKGFRLGRGWRVYKKDALAMLKGPKAKISAWSEQVLKQHGLT